MKKRIVILSNRSESGNAMKSQLLDLFGDLFDVDSHSLENEIDSIISADLILSLSYQVVGYFIKYLAPDSDIYIVRCTIRREGWQKVMQLQPRTKAYVISDHDNASITAATLYELGAQHIDLLSYNPNFIPDSEIKVAIVLNEYEKIPQTIEKVINIGERVLDSYTLFDILSKLGHLNERTSNIIINHMGEIIPRSTGFLSMIGNIMGNMEYVQNAINALSEGFILFNPKGTIILFNKWAEKVFSKPSFEAIGCNIDKFLKENKMEFLIGDDAMEERKMLKNSEYIFTKQYLDGSRELNGGLIRIVEPTSKVSIENKKHYKSQGHKAKYSFEDIVGKSEKIKEAIEMAKIISGSDSGLIIYGETGSGKELFAHSIHNNSERRDNPFVAFNCAAVSDSLIESELFGYEEGAFTGAKKGGRKGLFEVADKGTLFLDEIGEISYGFQANLLRVLQEREIVRVGGTKVVPIDIRIIVATNKDLSKMVKEGKFRADLFYRLNIMRIKIPPLRERREDIPYLTTKLLRQKDVLLDIPAGIMKQMMEYNWPGNVRELGNCIEYIVNMKKGNMMINSLPEDMLETGKQADDKGAFRERDLVVLKLLVEIANDKSGSVGRRTLSNKLKENGYEISENEVRSILNRLKRNGYVDISIGRAGTRLTKKGMAMVN